MITISYQIEFFTFWHTSSGLAGGTYADLLVNRTRDGFPYVPGRTLKGLLREAAESIHDLQPDMVSEAFIQEVFGQEPTKDQLEKEGKTDPAKAFFANATLSKFLLQQVSKEDQHHLFNVVASTEIDGQTGTAKTGSLRQLEVAIPLTLHASIEQFPDEPNYREMIEYCMGWVKQMGLNRSRGLGRCKFSLT